MKFSPSVLLAAAFLAASSLWASAPAAEPRSQALFDGKSLEGWSGDPARWWVEGETITTNAGPASKQQNSRLVWKGELHDFDLTWECRVSGEGAPGLAVEFRRSSGEAADARAYGADFSSAQTRFGSIVEEPGRGLLAGRGTRVSIAPDGRQWSDPLSNLRNLHAALDRETWHVCRLRATATHVEFWIDGMLYAALDDHQAGANRLSGGLALLQRGSAEGGESRIRNLRLVDLGETKSVEPVAPPAVAASAPAGDERQKRLHESPVLWHLQPNPAKPTTIPNASAQQVVAGMMLTPGFQAELIAAEPEVRQPIAFAFDERGRLWVAEAYSYPNKQPDRKGKDRILIFEDRDGDGVFETRKVFMEGLNLVSGLEVGFGGVWVGAAPQLLFIPDRNHDDIPDGPPEVLLDGWGYQDTHETLNSFCWGPDGWLYGNQGVFTNSLIGKPGAPEAERVPLHSGVWRYHPIRHSFEIFAHGGSNQWGLDYNEAGHLFMTHCRSFYGGGGTTYVVRNGHFWNQSNSNFAPFISNAAPDFAPDLKNYLPAAAQYDSGEGGAGKPGSTAIYGGHAHAGTMIYLGDNWPEIYRDHLFTHNLFGHQMNHQENVRQGSAYETLHAGYDLLCAPDPRYMAVDLQTGPDGAVYVIDWCDLQHCHTPMDEKVDRSDGRIYRISWAESYHPVKVDLSTKSDLELAQLQTHRNDWYSRQARMLLEEHAAAGKVTPDAMQFLRKLAAESPQPPHVLRALWSLSVIGALDAETVGKALAHPSDLVRAWAIQLATDQPGGSLLTPEAFVCAAREDSSPAVRLALASALPALAPDTCWSVAEALAIHAEDKADRFLPKMIWFGLARVAPLDYRRALALAEKTPLETLADFIRWFAGTSPAGREALVSGLAARSDEGATRDLRLLAFALRGEGSAAAPRDWPAAQARLLASSAPAAHATADELAALFGDKAVLARLRGVLADDRASLAVRKSAFDLLKRVNDPEAVPIFVRLLGVDAFRSAAIPLVARSNDLAAASSLLDRFASLDENDRNAALIALSSRPSLRKKLLQAVSAGTFDEKQLSACQCAPTAGASRSGSR